LEPSPLLDEHMTEVFDGWLGVSADDVKGLGDEEVVWPARNRYCR
jgi:hypothetical protein